MKYRIVEKEAFTVIGKATSIIIDEKYTMLPQFWNDCKSDGTIAKLHELAGCDPIMGVGENGNSGVSFKYMIGFEAKEPYTVAMQAMAVPKSTWAIFEPVLSKPKYVGLIWEYIFNDFLPDGKYNLANTPDLEVNHRIGVDRYICEIWIPVIVV